MWKPAVRSRPRPASAYLALALIMLAALASWQIWRPGDWNLLSPGGLDLLSRHGLSTYTMNPSLQAGPLSLAVIGLSALTAFGPTLVHCLTWLCGVGSWRIADGAQPPLTPPAAGLSTVDVPLRQLVVIGALPTIAWLLSRSGRGMVGLLGAALILGAVCLPRLWPPSDRWRRVTIKRSLWLALWLIGPWADISAAWTHLDDGLAAGLLIAGVALADRQKPWMAAVAVGLALAAKPWAVVGLVVLLPDASDGNRSLRRFGPTVAAIVVGAGCWLPFVIADPATAHAASHAFAVSRESTIWQLGLHDAVAPPWLRAAQLLGATALAGLALRNGRPSQGNGRWDAVAVGLLGRLALDPSVFDYYACTAILLLAAADLVNGRRPVRSIVAIGVLWFAPATDQWSVAVGPIRALTVIGLIASLCLPADVLGSVSSWVRLRWSGRTAAVTG